MMSVLKPHLRRCPSGVMPEVIVPIPEPPNKVQNIILMDYLERGLTKIPRDVFDGYKVEVILWLTQKRGLRVTGTDEGLEVVL